jgi:Rab proteins geranylgeranyltransferase component A
MVSLPGSKGQYLMEEALHKLLQAFADAEGAPTVLWSLRYTQLGLPSGVEYFEDNPFVSPISDRIICFQPSSLDIAFDDGMVDAVKTAWKRLSGDDARDEEFMSFEDRTCVYSDDE